MRNTSESARLRVGPKRGMRSESARECGRKDGREQPSFRPSLPNLTPWSKVTGNAALSLSGPLAEGARPCRAAPTTRPVAGVGSWVQDRPLGARCVRHGDRGQEHPLAQARNDLRAESAVCSRNNSDVSPAVAALPIRVSHTLALALLARELRPCGLARELLLILAPSVLKTGDRTYAGRVLRA